MFNFQGARPAIISAGTVIPGRRPRAFRLLKLPCASCRQSLDCVISARCLDCASDFAPGGVLNAGKLHVVETLPTDAGRFQTPIRKQHNDCLGCLVVASGDCFAVGETVLEAAVKHTFFCHGAYPFRAV